MIAMIPIGSHRLLGAERDDAEVEAVRERDDRDRDREQVDREGPDHVEQARQDAVRPRRRRSPATTAMIVARMQQISAETMPMNSELRPP